MIARFILEEEGQTLVEYGLLISLLALAVLVGITLFGRGVERNWNTSNTKLGDAMTPSN